MPGELPENQAGPDAGAMQNFLEWLTRDWRQLDPEPVLEIRTIPIGAGPNQKTFGLDDIEAAVTWAAERNAAGENVYVVVNPKKAAARGRFARDENIVAAFFHFVDFDEAGAVERISKVQRSGTVTTGTIPHLRQHIYWRLGAPTTDMDAWRREQKRIVADYGGDKNCVNASRLMRLPGSISYPDAKKSGKGYARELVKAELGDGAYDMVPVHDTTVPEDGDEHPGEDRVCRRLEPEKDRRLLDLLRAKRNTFPTGGSLDEEDWRNANDRSAWLRLIFGIHAGYAPTKWADEARVGIIAFSARWENAPKDVVLEQLRERAAKVWDNAKADGGVGPATARAILEQLPSLEPDDVELQPPSGDAVDEQHEIDEIQLTGLAGELAELVRSGSKRRVKVLPDAGALMTLSALAATGFTIKGPEGTAALNLYGLVLAETGVGKEVVRQIIRSALSAANRGDEFLDTIASDRGLHQAMAKRGGKVALAIDEAGLSLEALRKGAQPHQRALVTFAMKLFGLGLDKISAHEYAENKKTIPEVLNPRLTMLWTSTPTAFETAIGQEDSESGQLNRFILFREPGLPPLRDDEVDRDAIRTLPRKVSQAINALAAAPSLSDAISDRGANVVEMSDDAEAMLIDFERSEVEEKIRQGGGVAESWSRATEQTLRISGLLALSDAAMDVRGRKQHLSHVRCERRHVDKAIALVQRALAGTVEVARNAGKTEHERHKDRIIKAIKKHADESGWAAARDVHRAIRGVKKRERDDLIEAMIEDGEIISEDKKPGSRGGRPARMYGLARPRVSSNEPPVKSVMSTTS